MRSWRAVCFLLAVLRQKWNENGELLHLINLLVLYWCYKTKERAASFELFLRNLQSSVAVQPLKRKGPSDAQNNRFLSAHCAQVGV